MGLFSWLKGSVETVKRVECLEEQRDFLEHCLDTLNDMDEVINMFCFLVTKEILTKEEQENEDSFNTDKKQYYIDLLFEYDLYDDYRVWVEEQMQECEDEFEDDEDLD